LIDGATMKRTFLNSLVAVVGFVAAAVVGGYLFLPEQRHPQEYSASRFFAWSELAYVAAADEFDLNSKDAEVLLLKSLYLYEQGTQVPAGDPVHRAMLMRCGLINARLSILRDEAGDTEKAKLYLSKAQADLKTIGWTDVSAPTILQAVSEHRRVPH